MFLKNEHIYLRALEPNDLDALYDIENNTAIWKVSNTQTPFSKHILNQYLNNQQNDIYTNKQLRLIIAETKTNTTIGTIDLFDFDVTHNRIGVGILLLEDYRQKGFANQALQLIIHYVFETLMLNQLFCNIAATNIDSINLFEKCGFKKIGLKKQWTRITKNEYNDEWMLQLIK